LFDQRWAGRASIDQLRRSTNPIDLNVTLGDDKPSIAIGDGKMLATRVASHNKIPLKFGTKELVAEYFHYAGDLFLVHKSGCSRTCLPINVSPGEYRHNPFRAQSRQCNRRRWPFTRRTLTRPLAIARTFVAAGSIAFLDITNYYPSQSVKSWRVNCAQVER
jgi:hypothetical protein